MFIQGATFIPDSRVHQLLDCQLFFMSDLFICSAARSQKNVLQENELKLHKYKLNQTIQSDF